MKIYNIFGNKINTNKDYTMKKLLLFCAAVLLSSFFYSFTMENANVRSTVLPSDVQYSVPSDVKTIIDKSCFECHNSDGRTAGKMKLKFDEMQDMKNEKQVSKLLKIVKVMEKGKMPPKKFSEDLPDKVPTQEEINKLINWAEKMALTLGSE